LIEATERCGFSNCLVVSPGRGQVGWHAKSLCPTGDVMLWYVDAFRADQATQAASNANANLKVVCAADLPSVPIQLALIPVLRRGEAEMTREILQQAHEQLDIGGQLIASVNNENDHWLRSQLQQLFPKVHCQRRPGGWVYQGTKLSPLKKRRSFSAEVVFRDRDRLITILTRPSVFSHRSLDGAARLLIQHGNVQPGDSVLDLGCGSGAVAIAAGLRSQTGQIHAVDCNTRAVECTRHSASRNNISNVTAVLNHDGELPQIGDCDVALLNPPYYADFGIAKHFMRTACRLLKAGGRIVVVTKQREAYHRHDWPQLELESEVEVSGYQLLKYRKH
jgi:16S rRNA (guanine1207-N2)-methyltransferase